MASDRRGADPIDLGGFDLGYEPSAPTPPRTRVPEQPAKREQSVTKTAAQSQLPQATVQFNTRLSLEARARVEEIHNRTGLTRQAITEMGIMQLNL